MIYISISLSNYYTQFLARSFHLLQQHDFQLVKNTAIMQQQHKRTQICLSTYLMENWLCPVNFHTQWL